MKVEDSDQVTRHITDGHFKTEPKTSKEYVHWKAFSPRKRDPDPKGLSVAVTTNCEERRISEIGEIVAKARGRPLHGWANLIVSDVSSHDSGLSVDYVPGDFPEHAEILGWASDEELDRRTEQAKHLMKLATVGKIVR